MKTIIKRLMLTTAVLMAVSLSARADIYTFDSITAYTNSGYQSVASQMTMEVVSSDTNSAVLNFSNAGPVVSSVAQIYFEYTGYTGSEYTVAAPTGWGFGETPPYLPAGDTVGFYGDFYLTANPPPSMNGIEAGESLSVTLSYDPYFDIIAALDGGELRVGLHVVGIPDAEGLDQTYSESMVNIPEAASSSLILLCSVGSLFIRRFFRS